mmetsp:Transcript_9723/g.39811  ORF Transcript_9723/g.39811 Transcript_9723/m.39811 type:complete len:243 (+) Transcript_9723:3209-3937(+)
MRGDRPLERSPRGARRRPLLPRRRPVLLRVRRGDVSRGGVVRGAVPRSPARVDLTGRAQPGQAVASRVDRGRRPVRSRGESRTPDENRRRLRASATKRVGGPPGSAHLVGEHPGAGTAPRGGVHRVRRELGRGGAGDAGRDGGADDGGAPTSGGGGGDDARGNSRRRRDESAAVARARRGPGADEARPRASQAAEAGQRPRASPSAHALSETGWRSQPPAAPTPGEPSYDHHEADASSYHGI